MGNLLAEPMRRTLRAIEAALPRSEGVGVIVVMVKADPDRDCYVFDVATQIDDRLLVATALEEAFEVTVGVRPSAEHVVKAGRRADD